MRRCMNLVKMRSVMHAALGIDVIVVGSREPCLVAMPSTKCFECCFLSIGMRIAVSLVSAW